MDGSIGFLVGDCILGSGVFNRMKGSRPTCSDLRRARGHSSSSSNVGSCTAKGSSKAKAIVDMSCVGSPVADSFSWSLTSSVQPASRLLASLGTASLTAAAEYSTAFSLPLFLAGLVSTTVSNDGTGMLISSPLSPSSPFCVSFSALTSSFLTSPTVLVDGISSSTVLVPDLSLSVYGSIYVGAWRGQMIPRLVATRRVSALCRPNVPLCASSGKH
ncbi:uncharacterized protein V1510DRAFT_125273 [Dipodascopsis tothii]|uniref:uncharacterized protein n=1 Tax=Dipodascopsis tothii TaxID=44089 RepID=UPI0034CDEBC5